MRVVSGNKREHCSNRQQRRNCPPPALATTLAMCIGYLVNGFFKISLSANFAYRLYQLKGLAKVVWKQLHSNYHEQTKGHGGCIQRTKLGEHHNEKRSQPKKIKFDAASSSCTEEADIGHPQYLAEFFLKKNAFECALNASNPTHTLRWIHRWEWMQNWKCQIINIKLN